jgi:hypothetical protein
LGIVDISFNVHNSFDLLHIKMRLSLAQYLSVADNARDAVLLHVSASSERQELGNETGAMTKTTVHPHHKSQRGLWHFCLVLLYNRAYVSERYIKITHTR